VAAITGEAAGGEILRCCLLLASIADSPKFLRKQWLTRVTAGDRARYFSEKGRRFRALARVVRHRPMSSQWTQGLRNRFRTSRKFRSTPAKFFTFVSAGKHRTETKTFSGYLSLEGSAKATSFVPGFVP
jgi:hypothetical protein